MDPAPSVFIIPVLLPVGVGDSEEAADPQATTAAQRIFAQLDPATVVDPSGEGVFPDDVSPDPVGNGDPAAPVPAVAGAGGDTASPGSAAGGRTGRAAQNQPMICMPAQDKVPDPLS